MKIVKSVLVNQDNELDYFPIRKLEYQGSEYRLHYCLKGKGIFRITNGLRPVGKGDFILTYPNERYSLWSSTEENISFISIYFMLIETEYQLYNLINLNLMKERQFHLEDDMNWFMQILNDHIGSQSENREKAAQHMLISLLYTLSTEDKAIAIDDDQRRYIDKSIAYMRENLNVNLSLKDLCDHVNLTESYMIKLFHRYTGTTPIKFHTRLRIEQASRYLTESMLSVYQITEKLNFSSESHFSRTFKKCTGYSPNQYKKHYLQQMGEEVTDHKGEIRDMFNFMQTIIDSARDLIFFKDKRGILLGCNDSFCEIMGLTKDQIIGKRDLDIFPEDEARFYINMDKVIFKTGQARRNKEWMTYPDGRKRRFEVYKGPITDADNNIIGLVGISRDITDTEDINDNQDSSQLMERILELKL
jgi:PAS domain S-box-containing protein